MSATSKDLQVLKPIYKLIVYLIIVINFKHINYTKVELRFSSEKFHSHNIHKCPMRSIKIASRPLSVHIDNVSKLQYVHTSNGPFANVHFAKCPFRKMSTSQMSNFQNDQQA